MEPLGALAPFGGEPAANEEPLLPPVSLVPVPGVVPIELTLAELPLVPSGGLAELLLAAVLPALGIELASVPVPTPLPSVAPVSPAPEMLPVSSGVLLDGPLAVDGPSGLSELADTPVSAALLSLPVIGEPSAGLL